MSFCQVSGCERKATSRCSAGFRYCAYHRQFVERHGDKGQFHSWQRIVPHEGNQDQTLKEFLK